MNATVAGAGVAAAPDPVTGLRIALFSSCVRGWSAERVLRAAGELGVDAVEWGVGPGEAIAGPDDGARVAELCATAGVDTVGLSVQDPAIALTAPARVAARHVALAAALGARQIRFFAERYDGAGLGARQQANRRALDRLAEPAAAAGVRVLVETSPATIAPSPELAMQIVGHQPADVAGVLYDPGNMIIEGDVSPALTADRLGAHLAHVHVKNIVWARVADRWRWRYAQLRRGRVRWPEVIAALRGAGYDGWFSLDHLAGRSTRAALRDGSEVLRELLNDAEVLR